MLYAVLDTNVLVSAALASRNGKNSPPWKVLALVFAGSIIPVFNEEILQEYREVLHRRKFKFDTDVVDKLVSEIKRIGISQQALEVSEDFPDKDDAVFFEVAMGAKEEYENSYLVTGNLKHFPRSPIVVTPAQFIHLLELLEHDPDSFDQTDTEQ
ncbi:MAG: putative toxin-antitoxin system toxin component, PIN family [Chordicoccus sp.]